MSAAPGDATSWRQLADALTPHQIAELEHWEAHPGMPPRTDGARSAADHQRTLLFVAREYLGQNAAGVLLADVPPPPDDGGHYPWEHDGEGGWVRFFTGAERKIGETIVMINGLQHQDGAITRSICIAGETESLDASAARQVAAAIIELAEQVERRMGS